MRVEGDITLESKLLIKGEMSGPDPDGQGVAIKGDLHRATRGGHQGAERADSSIVERGVALAEQLRGDVSPGSPVRN